MSVKKVYERVVDENEELCGKILLLGELIYNGTGKRPKSISKYQWKLLKKQLKAMQKYQRILGARLEDLYCQAFNEHANKNKAEFMVIDNESDKERLATMDDVISGAYGRVDYKNESTPQATFEYQANKFQIEHPNGKVTEVGSNDNPVTVTHTVTTPGQEKPGHDYLPDAKIQSAKDFMKDDNE